MQSLRAGGCTPSFVNSLPDVLQRSLTRISDYQQGVLARLNTWKNYIPTRINNKRYAIMTPGHKLLNF
ncbi:hypothetical protein D1AOALGA4SA_7331 [Olavius algarvensis Delta 1 endosymbiont]|nr:hypothetical protein D1AOALGA4SA_7331 [Olavius algarvensis Delta 1 endosymbiont]